MNVPTFGHNETTVRLGLLADDARHALEQVSRGEGDALSGWLAYGAALNEGRKLFPSDEQFGQWVDEVVCTNLVHTPRREDRSAAMWAAAQPEQFSTAQAAGNARTVRGIYAKWQELDAERAAAEARQIAEAERAKAEAERMEAAEARRKADAERAEVKARAEAEEAARRAAERAKNEAERKAAQNRADVEAKAKAEAAARVKESEDKAKSADGAAKTSEKRAKAADKTAKSNDKKASQAKSGNVSDKTAHVSNNSGENEWYTPALIIEAARDVLGGFDLDPASSEIANRNVQAARIFTAEDDGLAQDWPIGSIWMNPPYAQPLMGQFADKFATEVRRGSSGIVLVNNATETVWFQTIAAECSAICFPKTRIRFLDPDGNPGAPLQGQAIIYCGQDAAAFVARFAAFGLVVSHG